MRSRSSDICALAAEKKTELMALTHGTEAIHTDSIGYRFQSEIIARDGRKSCYIHTGGVMRCVPVMSQDKLRVMALHRIESMRRPKHEN